MQILCSRRVGILCKSEVSLLHFIFVPSSLIEKHFPSLEDTPPSQDLEQVDHLDHSNHTASTSCRVRLSSVPCFFFFFYSNTIFENIYSFVFKIVKKSMKTRNNYIIYAMQMLKTHRLFFEYMYNKIMWVRT